MTWGEILKVREAVDKAGAKYQSGLSLRWNPFVRNLRSMLDSEMFGKLFYIEVDYFHKLADFWNGFTWGGQNKSGGPSASLVAGLHAVDLLRYLCGEAAEVSSYQTWGHREDFGDTFPGQTGWQRFETVMPDSGAVSHHPYCSSSCSGIPNSCRA